MIKFSWKKINNKFNWNAYSVLEYFFLIHKIKIPTYLNRKIPELVKNAAMQPLETGPCFLINPIGPLEGAIAPHDLYMYLELVSRRNIFDYEMRGITHLPMLLADKYQLPWVNNNSMMKIEKDNIYFKYEQENKQWL